MGDIVLDILNSLSGSDKIEVTSLSKPLAGDAVWSSTRETYGGGIIISVDHDEDEYLVAWWNPEPNGIHLDCTVYEMMDFTHYKDGKSGRMWFVD
jgi:hypothetical protein